MQVSGVGPDLLFGLVGVTIYQDMAVAMVQRGFDGLSKAFQVLRAQSQSVLYGVHLGVSTRLDASIPLLRQPLQYFLFTEIVRHCDWQTDMQTCFGCQAGL